MVNQAHVEPRSNLGPWLGDYARWAPEWTVFVKSSRGGAMGLVQTFGTSQVVVYTGLLDGDNLKKILPVRMLLVGILNTWLSNRDISCFDPKTGAHLTMSLKSHYATSSRPIVCTICLDSVEDSNTKGTVELDITITIKKGNTLFFSMQEHVFLEREMDRAAFCKIFKIDTSQGNSHAWTDGIYKIKADLKSRDGYIKLSSGNLDFQIDNRIDKIESRLQMVRSLIDDNLGNMPVQNQAAFDDEWTGPTEEEYLTSVKIRKLLFLKSRVRCASEIFENIINDHCDIVKIEKQQLGIEDGFHININTLDQLDRITSECDTRAQIIPSHSPIMVNEKYRLLYSITSDITCESTWECNPGKGMANFLGSTTNGGKGTYDQVAFFRNGVYMIGATCIEEKNPESALKRLEDFKRKNEHYTEYFNGMLLGMETTQYGNRVYRGILVTGNLVFTIHSYSEFGMQVFAERVLTSKPVTGKDCIDISRSIWGALDFTEFHDASTLYELLKGSTLVIEGPVGRKPREDSNNARKLGISAIITGQGHEIDHHGVVHPATVRFTKSEPCIITCEPGKTRSRLFMAINEDITNDVEDILEFLVFLKQVENHELMYYMCDLHSHSTASDGSFNPIEVGIAAINANLDVFGLTDHHSIWASNFLHEYANKHGWSTKILPGCQEVTQTNAHYIAVCARKSVCELVEPERIVDRLDEAGSLLNIYAHSRLPHPYNDRAKESGKKSGFDAFVSRPEHLQYMDTWMQSDSEPAWVDSTDTPDNCFGSASRTIIFSNKISLMSLRNTDVCETIKRGNCVSQSGGGLFGKTSLKLLARAIYTLRVFQDAYRKRTYQASYSLLPDCFKKR